ncbi:MAG TPA: ParB/RepB/Spo0J family partition protein [Phycisphaerae bacterium]|nr:ParB/RepB/Spo0J family partition protein [Phycisphaerae bacterium]
MNKPQSRLGRGLSSLISIDPVPSAHEAAGQAATAPMQPGPRITNLKLSELKKNPAQPRRTFDETSLVRLAASFKERGVLQPVLVRRTDAGYELIAGERRMRAAAIAGIQEIPAIIRSARDEELLELALIENLHREDLNPIERAKAYQVLGDRYNLTQDQIASRTGDDRATIANYQRLLSLPEEIQNLVSARELSAGHAKAIVAITDRTVQLQLARRAAGGQWSVRQTEVAVAKTRPGAKPDPTPARPAVKDIEEKLSQRLGTRVSIREGRRKHTGKLTIEYYNLDDFERITRLLGVPAETA